ncbi:unnamed protein product [Rotaria sordida]|uniref:AMP-dependent synthetase/ligase domain-containing protein n=1 Tax=Rotaria sordida TaxID=392033 RepID=A0A819JF21_9BILA|nr:unnamed protein product [Rotaria sordida]
MCLSWNTHLLNTYGTTETTVDCTYRHVSLADVVSSQTSPFIPLGSPLPNYICHIMIDKDGDDETIGELYIGGPGVFSGYLNHGQRIETGEIEGTILREFRQQISAGLVIARDDRLVAYVQSRLSDTTIEQRVMEICRQHLPSNMIPSAIIVLDQFPLNANGKVDRSRLPSPLSLSAISSISETPQNDLEVELQSLWSQFSSLHVGFELL